MPDLRFWARGATRSTRRLREARCSGLVEADVSPGSTAAHGLAALRREHEVNVSAHASRPRSSGAGGAQTEMFLVTKHGKPLPCLSACAATLHGKVRAQVSNADMQQQAARPARVPLRWKELFQARRSLSRP